MARRNESKRFANVAAAILCGIVAMMTPITRPADAAATTTVTVGGPFTLIAPDGTTVTDQTYRGKWLLVYFGFTHCPDSCPMALFEISAALAKLGPDADEVQPLFITVDPRRDTPAVLGDYTQEFDRRIVGLTGTPQQIATVAEAYGVYYAPHKTGPGDDDYVMDHGTYLYLMDRDGRFVRGFDAEATGGHIADAVRKIIAQSRANR